MGDPLKSFHGQVHGAGGSVLLVSHQEKQLKVPGIQQALLYSPGHLSHSIGDLVTGRVCKADIQETPEVGRTGQFIRDR